jgi:hypothetical protein
MENQKIFTNVSTIGTRSKGYFYKHGWQRDLRIHPPYPCFTVFS